MAPQRFTDPKTKGGKRIFSRTTGKPLRGRRASRTRIKSKRTLSKEDRNQLFSDFRAGKVSRNETIRRLRSSTDLAEFRAVDQQINQPQLNAQESKAIEIARERRDIARSRGRPFTRLESQEFIAQRGGSVQALRSARAKGFTAFPEGEEEPEEDFDDEEGGEQPAAQQQTKRQFVTPAPPQQGPRRRQTGQNEFGLAPLSSISSGFLQLMDPRGVIDEVTPFTTDILSKQFDKPLGSIPVLPGAVNINVGKAKGQLQKEGLPGRVAADLIPSTRGELASVLVAPAALKAVGPVGRAAFFGTVGGVGAKTALNKNETIERRIIGGIGVGVGAAGLAAPLFSSKAITRPTRAAREPSFIEVQKPVSVGGKQTTAVKSIITGEVRPPTETVKTSPFRRLIGREKVTSSTPSKEFVIQTTPEFQTGKKILFSEIRTGEKSGKFFTVTGGTRKQDLQAISSLPKSVQQTTRDLAGRKTGLPTSISTAKTSLSKDNVFVSSSVKNTLFKSNPKEGSLTFLGSGRRTQRGVGTLETKSLFKGPSAEFFKVDTALKDVSLPTRTKGARTQFAKGILVRETKSPGGGLFGFKSGQSLTKTQKTDVVSAKALTGTRSAQPREIAKLSPKSGGKLGIGATLTSPKTRSNTLTTPKISTITGQGINTKPITRTTPKSRLNFFTGVRTRSGSGTASILSPRIKQAKATRTNQLTDQGQRLRQSTLTRQVRRATKGGGISTLLSPPRTSTSSTRNPFSFTFGRKLKKEKRRKGEPSLLVETRRGGRFRPIGRASSVKQAFSLGTSNVKNTLAATFRVKGLSGGVGLPTGFRRGRGANTFIQRRGQRLSSFGERSSIQRAKRRKRKR